MRIVFAVLVSAVLVIGIIGCNVSKPYIIKTDRVDQELAGNRGYLAGTPPPAENRAALKRSLIAVDIDLPQVKGKATEQTKLVNMPGKCGDMTNDICGVPEKKAAESQANIK